MPLALRYCGALEMSGNPNVLCPSPPWVVPIRLNNVSYSEMGSNCPWAQHPALRGEVAREHSNFAYIRLRPLPLEHLADIRQEHIGSEIRQAERPRRNRCGTCWSHGHKPRRPG